MCNWFHILSPFSYVKNIIKWLWFYTNSYPILYLSINTKLADLQIITSILYVYYNPLERDHVTE